MSKIVKPTKIIKMCGNCKYYEKEIPHTCDVCDSLDTPDYYMWELDKEKNGVKTD